MARTELIKLDEDCDIEEIIDLTDFVLADLPDPQTYTPTPEFFTNTLAEIERLLQEEPMGPVSPTKN